MKQFNLLIVSKEPGANNALLKTASKIFRKSFVLHVTTLDEAYPLLKRLNINLLLVDMDGEKVNFHGLNQGFPNLTTIGTTSKVGSQTIPPDPIRNRILLKSDLKASLYAELKAIRKDKGYANARQTADTPRRVTEPADFKNFLSLVGAH